MSNTLKFGNGLWATKEGSTLAYNDENGNYKPLPFNFERAGSATRVNKEGLIEVVGNNEPRIDFSNDAKGALLLEPSRTNINTNSESFNTYSLVGGSFISDNLISPNGFLTADSFVEDSNDSQHTIRKDIAVSAGNYTVSCFVKGVDRFLSIYPQGVGVAYSVFDLNNGTITKTGGADYIDSKIENYGNGWYRCILTYSVIDGDSRVHLYLSNISSGTGAEAPIYIGNGSIMSFYGLQLEQGSYATSYIPTSGSIATRVADVCNNGGNEQVFNDSEGVLYVEISAFSETNLFEAISINNNSTSDRIFIGYFSDDLYITILDGGQAKYDVNTPINVKQNNKIAVKYKAQDFSFYLNGFEINASAGINGGTTPSGLSELSFNRGDGVEPFYGNIKQIKYFDKALTDQELIALTS